MSALSTLGGSLLVEAGALVLNCCCIVLDIVCDRKPCLRDWDCKYYPNCICIDGRCEDAVRDECPPGYTEIPLEDGSGQVRCEANCTGDPCQDTADCAEGCVCVDGRCVPSSDAFFCIDGECQRGGDLEYDPADPDRPKGPYPTYQACCMATDEDGNMCGCGFACTDSCQCIPSEEQVDYESYQECRAECCDPDEAGRCCYNEVIKDDQGVLLSVEWYDCANSLNEDCEDGPIEPTAGGGTRQITATFTKGVDCDPDRPPGLDPNLPWGEGCPIPEYGACCILDGNDVIDCIEETKAVCDDMPNRPGDFPQYPAGFTTDSKSSTWSDCTTRRNPVLNEDFACADCNGEKDCACANDEKCTGQECSLCYDSDPTKRGAMVRAQAGVDRQIAGLTAGETVTYYIRNCTTDAAGNPITVDDADRKAKMFISYGCGDTSEEEISEEGSYTANQTGTLYVTGIAGNPEVQVCVTLERDAPTEDCGDCVVVDKTLDPNPQPPDQNIRVRRSLNTPNFDNFDWKPGYPNCLLPDGTDQIFWVMDFYSCQFNDGNTRGSTSKTLYRLFACVNGVITKVPLDEAVVPEPLETTGCVGTPTESTIVHPNGLDWSVSIKINPDGTCEYQEGFNVFGLNTDIPDLPDEVDFDCNGVPIQVGYNPLP